MQRPKEHIRSDIVAAASRLFAERGFAATSIALVAEHAGTSTGNVYRYFEGKESLFAAVLPRELAVELERRTRARVEALGTTRDVREVASGARYQVLSDELLDFCIEHREQVVILLARAKDTPFASFEASFRRKLVDWAIAYLRDAWPTVRVTPLLRFTLDRVYAAFVKPDTIREAVLQLTAHHQGGLLRLFETVATPEHTSGDAPRS